MTITVAMNRKFSLVFFFFLVIRKGKREKTLQVGQNSFSIIGDSLPHFQEIKNFVMSLTVVKKPYISSERAQFLLFLRYIKLLGSFAILALKATSMLLHRTVYCLLHHGHRTVRGEREPCFSHGFQELKKRGGRGESILETTILHQPRQGWWEHYFHLLGELDYKRWESRKRFLMVKLHLYFQGWMALLRKSKYTSHSFRRLGAGRGNIEAECHIAFLCRFYFLQLSSLS